MPGGGGVDHIHGQQPPAGGCNGQGAELYINDSATTIASTEGASPPMSSPIFVSSSIAGLNDVSVMFKPLIFHYCIPIVFVGVLVAMGILPIIGG